MIDDKTSKALVWAYSLWAAVAVTLAQAWLALALEHANVALMLGLTACSISAVAATAHVRCFAIRVLAVVRRLHGIEDGQDDGDGSSGRGSLRRVT